VQGDAGHGILFETMAFKLVHGVCPWCCWISNAA
jgi:hypothetical protein